LLAVTTDCGEEGLRASTAELRTMADRLAALVPDASGPRFGPGPDEGETSRLDQVMPFDMVVGRCNPIAPPVAIAFDPPLATGLARFSAAYEGAPGWVHGAAVAAAFDMVLTAANMVRGVAGPTVSLSLRYRRPTLLDEDCHFEAWVEAVEGDRVRTRGQLKQSSGTTVEAEGEFINVHYDEIKARSSESRT
jgi:acyl-coenzyme A thioesterase PaaI-like protein